MDAEVLVLGASGMLGSVVARVLADELALPTAVSLRAVGRVAAEGKATAPKIPTLPFDARTDDPATLLQRLPSVAWVVNAIGVIKPFISDDAASRWNAVAVNAAFPYRLAEAAERHDVRVIQIATDCVYAGRNGPYGENSPHDPDDVYGMTKSLGEVPSAAVMHLRTSIIGPEPASAVSLLEWLLSQPPGATLNGYDNHLWNGVTTLHFARVAGGIIRAGTVDGAFNSGVQHLVPADVTTKAELLVALAQAYGRDDLTIRAGAAPVAIDRRLATTDEDMNRRLWSTAGYATPPTIATMTRELAASASRHRVPTSAP